MLRLVVGVVGAPVVMLVLLSRPGQQVGGDSGPPRRPVRRGDSFPLALLRGVVEIATSCEVTACIVGAAIEIVRRQHPSITIIDDDQRAIVVAIGIVRIADQIGIVLAGLVIVVAIAT